MSNARNDRQKRMLSFLIIIIINNYNKKLYIIYMTAKYMVINAK